MSLCSVKLVKLLPVHRYNVDIFSSLVLQEHWILEESRIPLDLVLVVIRYSCCIF